jgi:DNA-binding PucR family transcriptional regulator
MPQDDATIAFARSLDRPGEPLDGEEIGRLAVGVGVGAARWVRGAVRSSIDAIRAREDADRLAPLPQVRALAEHVLASVIARLAASAVDDDHAVDRIIASDIVSRDIGLPRVVEVMRVFQNHWMTLLVDAALAQPDGARLVPEIARTTTDTVDAWVDAFIKAVLAERERTFQSQHARARGTIEALVEARAFDESAPALLGIPLDGWHIGCVISAPVGAIIEQRTVDAAVSAFARSTGVDAPLRYDTSTGSVWLWACSTRPSAAPSVDDLRVSAPLVVGVGEPHTGPEGFRRTHLEALDALRVHPPDSRGAAYREVALAALLSADAERGRWFVDLTLGEIAADTDEMADLRDTLRTFFATRMRIAPAADLLFVHRNTLISRLERIERHLGHPVAARTAETQAALLLHDLLADA